MPKWVELQKKTVTGYIKFKNTAVRLQPSMSKTGKKLIVRF